MGRYVIYNGKGKEVEKNRCLTEGKKYEIVLETLYQECKTVRLKGIPGEYDASLFEDVEEGIHLNTKVMKPAYLAKATIYQNINSYIGGMLLLEKLNSRNEFEEFRTTPVEKIENIYGDIYKIETKNSVYITEVRKRTVG